MNTVPFPQPCPGEHLRNPVKTCPEPGTPDEGVNPADPGLVVEPSFPGKNKDDGAPTS